VLAVEDVHDRLVDGRWLRRARAAREQAQLGELDERVAAVGRDVQAVVLELPGAGDVEPAGLVPVRECLTGPPVHIGPGLTVR
jgi:hypothetical protein